MFNFLVFISLALNSAWSQTASEEILTPSQDDVMELEKVLGMRDPFLKPNLKLLAAKGRPRSPLQFYPASDFKLAGVITGRDRLKAMVVAPNGKTYFVNEQDEIGTKDGKIVRIDADKIQIRESVVNLIGQKESIITTLRMNDGDSIGGTASGGFNKVGAVEVIRRQPASDGSFVNNLREITGNNPPAQAGAPPAAGNVNSTPPPAAKSAPPPASNATGAKK